MKTKYKNKIDDIRVHQSVTTKTWFVAYKIKKVDNIENPITEKTILVNTTLDHLIKNNLIDNNITNLELHYDKLSMDYKISGILHVIPEYQRKYEDSLINLIKFEENLW